MKSNLPNLKSKKKLIQDMEDPENLREAYNPFKAHMEKVIEIRIFLKFNFHKNDIDDAFINDLEQEYACQFLEKMEFLPTKQNISKLLKVRPIENCDFHLTQEQVRNKLVKLIHIYPNNRSEKKTKDKLKILLSSNEEFEGTLKQNLKITNKEDVVGSIKKREIKRDEMLLFQREIVDNMISDAKDDIVDKQLYFQNQGMNDKKLLSIENIREKYLNPNAKNILEFDLNDKMNAKAKFQNIDKSHKRDILSDEKYQFKFLNINLTKDILDEVSKPEDTPIEIIMKDVNFILDNFPIEELIEMDDDNQMKEMAKTTSFRFRKETISRKQLYYKIKQVKKEDLIYVYKKIQNKNVFRIIGLTINLIYWIVFGFIDRFQIDKATKQYLFFKLLQEIKVLEVGFRSRRLYNKIFMPLLILIVRIECENVFVNKFKILFENQKNKQHALEKINELITVIYDPHAYYNTFTIIGGNTAILKHKLNKKILPKFKSKTYVTSNLVDQLFTKFKSQKNIIHNREKGMNLELDKDLDVEVWDREKKYIADSKTAFFGVLFNKMNQDLKKRNLEPIFTIKNPQRKNKKSDINNYQLEEITEEDNTVKNRTDGFHLRK